MTDATHCERCGQAFGTGIGQVSRSVEKDLCQPCKWELSAEDAAFDAYYGDRGITSTPETFRCIECGESFTGAGRLCARCYCEAKC